MLVISDNAIFHAGYSQSAKHEKIGSQSQHESFQYLTVSEEKCVYFFLLQ
jgi:hypothetical protein